MALARLPLFRVSKQQHPPTIGIFGGVQTTPLGVTPGQVFKVDVGSTLGGAQVPGAAGMTIYGIIEFCYTAKVLTGSDGQEKQV